MNTKYVAHIYTAEAATEGEPEIIIYTPGVTEPTQFIARYPLEDMAPIELLAAQGWRLRNDRPVEVDPGYSIVDVEIRDITLVVEYITKAKDAADEAAALQKTAQDTVIRNAMLHDNGSATAIARAADMTPSRVYQIRDGRR